jgi:hypothetical protein
MHNGQFLKQRIIFTSVVTAAIGALLWYSYLHGGVPSHHILNKKELPAISNWWGGLLVPLVTWGLLSGIMLRLAKNPVSQIPHSVYWGFIGAFVFAVAISVLFSYNVHKVPGLLLQGALVLSLFYPIYRAECLLGFILGLIYTFGGVLPVGIGAILAGIGAILFLIIRPAALYIFQKLKAVV